MTSPPGFTFRIASQDWEFEQIHRLNYQTFVEEIPQHQRNPGRKLIDKFHSENTYMICLQDDRLLGMVAARGQRPFSLDQKLADLDSYLPPCRSVCEVRLLAVQPAYRSGRIFQGLMTLLAQHCQRNGYDLAIISGATNQRKLYQHLGFVPFGPPVGTPEAPYQPMYRTLETVEEDFAGRFRTG